MTDREALQDALECAGSDLQRWSRWSDNGVEAVSRHFSWDAHVCSYLALMQERLMAVTQPIALQSSIQTASTGGFQPLGDRLLLLDLDSNLEQPDGDALKVLREQLDRCALGILSGRSLPAARQRFAELLLPEPKVWITGALSLIHI